MDNTCRNGITYLSLCSGYDGIGLGLEIAGVRIAFTIHVEVETFAGWNLVNKIQAGAMGPGVLYPDVKTFPFERFRGTINLLSAGFPCFAAGTLVLCEDGYKPIEDVQVGDSVLTHRGRWRRVAGVMQRPRAELRRIKAYGCGDIITTPEHPFYIRNRQWKYGNRKKVRIFSGPRWAESRSLSKGCFLGEVLPPIEDDDHSELFWWLIGRYLADGWSQFDQSQSCGRVIICCNKNETAELGDRIRDAGFHGCLSYERTADKYHIVKKELYDFVQQFGSYAHGKKLPRIALGLPKNKAKALFGGYLSGDGCREKNSRGSGGSWRVGSVSEQLAYGMAIIARRVFGRAIQVRTHIPHRNCTIEGRRVNERIRYIVEVPDRNHEAFVEDDWTWKPVRQNSSVGIGTVYNISVEEDESYIVNGAVVHNCQPFSHAGRGKADEDPRHLFPFIKRGIEAACPDWVLLENVDGLVSRKLAGEGWHDPAGTPVLLHVLRELERTGYRATWGVFSAAEVGAPHQRKRVFILAKRLGPGIQPLLDDDVAELGFPLSGLFWPARPGRGQWWWEAPRVLRGGKLDDPMRDGFGEYVCEYAPVPSGNGQEDGIPDSASEAERTEMADPVCNGDRGRPGISAGSEGTPSGGREDRGPREVGDGGEAGTAEPVADDDSRGLGIGADESKSESVRGSVEREPSGVGEHGSEGRTGTADMADTGHALRGTGPAEGCGSDQQRNMAQSERGKGSDETAQRREAGELANANFDGRCSDGEGSGAGALAEAEEGEGREGDSQTPASVSGSSGTGTGSREQGVSKGQLADSNSGGQHEGPVVGRPMEEGRSRRQANPNNGAASSESSGGRRPVANSAGQGGQPERRGRGEPSDGWSEDASSCGEGTPAGHGSRGPDMGDIPSQGLSQREEGGGHNFVQAAQYADGVQEGRQVVPEMGGNADVPPDGMGYAELLESKIVEATGCGNDELAEALERELFRFALSRSVDTRTDELRLLGNGVVPPCAARAFGILYGKLVEEVGCE